MHEFGVDMAARATRSSVAASGSSNDDSRCLLLALSHDELGVIFDGLADPLQPVVAVALSSTCKGLRTPLVLQAVMGTLAKRRLRALALCRKFEMSCEELRDADALDWEERIDFREEERVTTDDLATLGMLLPKSLPRLQRLDLYSNGITNAGMHALCAGLTHGAAPSLTFLAVDGNPFGLAGVEVLAAALSRGAMPMLDVLMISDSKIGQGLIALAAPLRKHPALKELHLCKCDIGDEGVAALVKDLGKDDFKTLKDLDLSGNEITNAGMVKLVAAINSGAMPMLRYLRICDNDGVSDGMLSALATAITVPSEARRVALSHME